LLYPLWRWPQVVQRDFGDRPALGQVAPPRNCV
jgi:hypothetical protein